MEDRNLTPLELGILQEGVTDWIDMGTVDSIARFYTDLRVPIEEAAAHAVSGLLTMGAIQVGDLSVGFHPSPKPWSVALKDAMAVYAERPCSWDFMIWLANTELGDRLAIERPYNDFVRASDPEFFDDEDPASPKHPELPTGTDSRTDAGPPLGELELPPLELSILQEGLHDWVSIGDVAAMVDFYSPPETDDVDGMKPALRHLLTIGALEIGDLKGPKHFRAWRGTTEAALRKAAALYRRDPREAVWHVWFNLTPAGKKVAEASPFTEYYLSDFEDE